MKSLVLTILMLGSLVALTAEAGTADPSGMPVNAATQWLENIAPNGNYQIISGISTNQKPCLLMIKVSQDSKAARISMDFQENGSLQISSDGGGWSSGSATSGVFLNYSDSNLPDVGESQYSLKNFKQTLQYLSYDMYLKTEPKGTIASSFEHVEVHADGTFKMREIQHDGTVNQLSCQFPPGILYPAN